MVGSSAFLLFAVGSSRITGHNSLPAQKSHGNRATAVDAVRADA
jgi:hypothetical protein